MPKTRKPRRKEALEDDPLRGFWAPLYTTKVGQINVLCAREEHIRDGLAAIQIARQFPLPEYADIRIEPSRPQLVPADNTIFIGRGALFMGWDLESVRPPRPVVPGFSRLGMRLAPIEEASCYVFEGNNPHRVLRNRMSGEVFRSEKHAGSVEVDYGVIKRVRKGGAYTFILEGTHGLGTMGAAMVATSRTYLAELWGAVSSDPTRDPSLLLEILVKATFDPQSTGGVYHMSYIEARPLSMVYNKKWIYDVQARIWIDQEPCDFYAEIKGAETHFHGSQKPPTPSGPWLDLEIDLKSFPADTRARCKSILKRFPDPAMPASKPPQPISALDKGQKNRLRMLDLLTASSDLINISLHEVTQWGGLKIYPLPEGQIKELKLLRKRFVVHMVLCRMLGLEFHPTDARLLELFPKFFEGPSKDRRDKTIRFSAHIVNRLDGGFRPLFATKKGEGDKNYLKFPRDRKSKSYRLLLQRLSITLRFRY